MMRRVFIAILLSGLLGATIAPGAAGQRPSPEPSAGEDASDGWPSTELNGARAIAANDDRFVVVGGGDDGTRRAEVWTSTDGLDWTKAPVSRALDGADMSHVIEVDDGFVAMGTGPKGRIVAWHSPDGLTWERSKVERAGKKRMDGQVVGVTDGPGGLVALGIFIGQDRGAHRLWHSTDGQIWSAVDGPDEIIPGLGVVPGIELFFSLASVPDGYWLVGRGGGVGGVSAVWRSRDGRSWKPLKEMTWLVDAAVNEDGTIAAISSKDIRVTDDLENWERVWRYPKANVYQGEPSSIDWDGTRFVAAGAFRREKKRPHRPLELWVASTDGYSWVKSNGPDGEPGPDPGTLLLGTASLDAKTVALGWTAKGTIVAWLMPWHGGGDDHTSSRSRTAQ